MSSQKYAIVTGASSGIGGSIALALAESGYFVALVGRNIKRLSEIEQKISAAKGESAIFIADLSTTDGANNLIDKIKSDIQQVNVLVNAAAI